MIYDNSMAKLRPYNIFNLNITITYIYRLGRSKVDGWCDTQLSGTRVMVRFIAARGAGRK